MRRDGARLDIVPCENGIGERVIDVTANPHARHQTAAAYRVMDVLCHRCKKAIGEHVFVTINADLYHLPCATVTT